MHLLTVCRPERVPIASVMLPYLSVSLSRNGSWAKPGHVIIFGSQIAFSNHSATHGPRTRVGSPVRTDVRWPYQRHDSYNDIPSSDKYTGPQESFWTRAPESGRRKRSKNGSPAAASAFALRWYRDRCSTTAGRFVHVSGAKLNVSARGNLAVCAATGKDTTVNQDQGVFS